MYGSAGNVTQKGDWLRVVWMWQQLLPPSIPLLAARSRPVGLLHGRCGCTQDDMYVAMRWCYLVYVMLVKVLDLCANCKTMFVPCSENIHINFINLI